MKVFVTGHKGYIGVHLVELLKERGHHVVGCDIGLFRGCEWEPCVKPDSEIIKDIRELTVKDFEGCGCAIHLAAISNDPMGELNPEITYVINREGSRYVAEIAKKAGVQRFLFSSSCAIYGKNEGNDVDEHMSLNPLSAYAVSKIDAESAISELADASFTPVFLRNSTAYGYSPMLRIDLVVNNLLACAFARGDIRIMSDGTPWRPLIHCRDIARAFIAFMEAPRDTIHNKRVNIGDTTENYQVKDIVEVIKRFIPQATVVFTGEIGNDPRSYRVNFSFLRKLLPDFRLQCTLERGIEELYKKFVEHRFSKEDFEGFKFVRLRALKKRLHLLGFR